MIYIFDGFKHICSLPGYCCQGCGHLCKNCPGACKAISDPFRKICTECGSYTKQFFEMPLSVYVLVSFLVSGYVAYLAWGEMGEEGCTSSFLYALMAFSVVNVIFAIYMQCKVWSEITSDKYREEIDSFTMEVNSQKRSGFGAQAGKLLQDAKAAAGRRQAGDSEGIPAQEGVRIVPSKVVQDSFKHVFQYDLVVLAMFFALVGVAILSAMGPATLDGDDASEGSMPFCTVQERTRMSGYYFLIVAFVWTFAYMCCSCCSNKVTLSEESRDEEAQE